MVDGGPLSTQRLVWATLIFAHIVICCISLVYASRFHLPGSPFDPKNFHILYDSARLYDAIIVVAAFTLVSLFFIFADFSFGYIVGFYSYTMLLGYLWLNCFSDLNYVHWLGGASAAASAVAFLFPALFMSSPATQIYTLSPRALEWLLRIILLLAAITLAVGASYNFRLVSLDNIYDYRDKLEFPTIINYLLGIVSNALLPFAFACFVTRNDRVRAGAVLLLLLLFYPITLSKLAFFTPLWLIFVLLLSRLLEVRVALFVSLFLPILAGVLLFALFEHQTAKYFGLVNFRMIAIPSVAMDVYNDFFSKHDVTYFCQISFLKPLTHCPYSEPLSIVMRKAYELGNFNASLFATEGIASVGPLLAPITALLCGLIIGLGNRLSAGLPPRFILISAAVLPQLFLNVPFTTVLLTHGAALIFLLWYLTPRAMFDENSPR